MGQPPHRTRIALDANAIGFVVPELGRPSGGSHYNDSVMSSWPDDRPRVVACPVRPGEPRTASTLRSALRAHRVSIVDGLLGCEHPGELAGAEAEGHRIALLVHMPRPEEPGLQPDDRSRLATLESAAVHAASAVIVPSRWAAHDLETRYGRTDLHVAVPGSERAPLAPAHPIPVMLQLGAIGPLKNQMLTARAALAAPRSSFVVQFVGPVVDESYAAELASLIRPLGRWAGVHPAVTGEDRDRVLARADLMVSVSRHESYGLTVTEGLARGIPALVGRGTGAQEALGAGGGLPGACVDTHDPAEMTAALTAFADDPGTRDRWRAAARVARDRLPSWAPTARRISEVCESLEHDFGARVRAEIEPP